MTAPSPLIETLVNRARELFSLPRVAMDVLELTKDPKVDARLLKDCIENDPALTSKLLRVVNSSLFGLSGEVSDLNQALALLGVKPLKLLVLGFSLPDGLFTGIAGDLLRRYWQHTLTKAVAAREICQTLWKVSGDEAFLCGLLQDIGQLVLIQDLGKPYVTFLRKMQDEEPDLLRLETRALGFDHTELTSRLLAHWNLPRDLVEAIARPRSADAIDRLPPEKQPVTQILHLAELIAQLVADAHTVVLPELLDAGRRYRGLTPTQLESLIDRLQAKVEQLAEVLTLTLPDDKDYREVLVQALGYAEDARVVLLDAMVESATRSALLAEETGLAHDMIVISAKVSEVPDLVEVYRMLADRCEYPLHLGLTEAGMGAKGIVASTAGITPLLMDGIGDTIRISLTPEPGGDRTEEVRIARQILQSLKLRSFEPQVTACPGCGRTTSSLFQEMAQDIEAYIRERMPAWSSEFPGVEDLTVAVMGCIVNGPGESKHADLGISLPGTAEDPKAPVYVDGAHHSTLQGEGIVEEFKGILEEYIRARYG